jgi:hypothetical protein
MALAINQPVPETPHYFSVFDQTTPPLHNWYRPGGGWTPDSALAQTILGGAVHWSEQKTPAGKSSQYYHRMIEEISNYHMYIRDWEPTVAGLQGSDGIQYHWVIDPEGGLWKVTPETKRTWNSFEGNSWTIAVCLLAGHGDIISDKAVKTLITYLDWITKGRADLPNLTAHPQTNKLANGRSLQTHGIMTHDEINIMYGRDTKGCCGIYAPIVQEWRAKQK